MNQNKVVLLHDAFDFKGGRERLVKILCEELGLDLAFGNATDESYDLSVLSGQTIDLNAYSTIPVYRTFKRFQAFLINSSFIRNYETVIHSGQNTLLVIRNRLQGRNIFYCHTPPRSFYDLKTTHLANLSLAKKLTHHIYNIFSQPLYESAIRKMDLVIANSENVKCGIKKYLDLDVQVIYPPCETNLFQWLGQGDYYLSTARLLSYK